jgi:hypothetical protein
MLVLSVERSVELLESAIGDLALAVGGQNPKEIQSLAHAAWKKLGQARALLRRPDLAGSLPAPGRAPLTILPGGSGSREEVAHG